MDQNLIPSPTTIVDAVRNRALRDHDETGFRFISRTGEEGECFSWRALWNASQALASTMPKVTDPASFGVMIFCDHGPHFVIALLATFLIGATAIPASGGAGIHVSERNAHILNAARPDLILHDLDEAQASALAERAQQAILINVERVQALPDPDTPEFAHTGGRLLQFTSGSTSAPKPVLLGPDQIVHNCQAIAQSYSLRPNSTGVHWLPLFHDMGLVGSVLVPMWVGGESIILRPSLFIQQPAQWLTYISKYRANITSAPNFAYERLSRALERGVAEDLDLSSLNAMVVGGEPVSETTMKRLMAQLEPRGLRKQAIAPSYGLAEAVLLVSSGQTEFGPVFRNQSKGMSHACLGTPVDGLTVSIRDAATGARLPDGKTGEIWIDGPGCGNVIPPGADWRKPTARRSVRTGDLGQLNEGKVLVTGRDADRIILRGRNLFSEEVEAAVRASQDFSSAIEGLVAFGTETDGTQVLVVLIERSPRHPAVDIAAVNQSVAARLGVKCERIVQLRRATLPRTTSGKIRRTAAREAFMAGQYDERVLYDDI